MVNDIIQRLEAELESWRYAMNAQTPEDALRTYHAREAENKQLKIAIVGMKESISQAEHERDQQIRNNQSRLECLARMESELAEARKDTERVKAEVYSVSRDMYRYVQDPVMCEFASRLRAAIDAAMEGGAE